jgi:hypothetical protein
VIELEVENYYLLYITSHNNKKNGNINAIIFANDIFRTLRDSWTGYFPVTNMSRDAYTFTQSIGASITYNFNTTRSKYKGTGAGNAEKERM